jgi:hypothetical protein
MHLWCDRQITWLSGSGLHNEELETEPGKTTMAFALGIGVEEDLPRGSPARQPSIGHCLKSIGVT